MSRSSQGAEAGATGSERDPKQYQPVPVAMARTIAEQYAKSIVIIFAHDPVHGMMHTTTYGTDAQNKIWAAQGGEIATKALGGVLDQSLDYEDYRLLQIDRLVNILKRARRGIANLIEFGILRDGYKVDAEAELQAFDAAIIEAEGILPRSQDTGTEQEREGKKENA